MANHRFDIHAIVPDGNTVRYKVACLCGAASGVLKHHWEAEDWGREHLAVVERVKAHLAPKIVSLGRQRDYFREQADNTANSAGDRRLWAALADELDHRCNDQGPANEGQEELFSIETERQKP